MLLDCNANSGRPIKCVQNQLVRLVNSTAACCLRFPCVANNETLLDSVLALHKYTVSYHEAREVVTVTMSQSHILCIEFGEIFIFY